MELNQSMMVSAQVTFQKIGDETVLLNLASGHYFGLNLVGTRIWQLLAQGQPPAAIVDTVAAEFAAPRDNIEQDTNTLLQQLIKNGLLVQS